MRTGTSADSAARFNLLYGKRLMRRRASPIGKSRDLTGLQFGRLTALYPHPLTKHRCLVWMCRCSCGGRRLCESRTLMSGRVRSCGCLLVETARENIRALHQRQREQTARAA